jgi:hypothetical protein
VKKSRQKMALIIIAVIAILVVFVILFTMGNRAGIAERALPVTSAVASAPPSAITATADVSPTETPYVDHTLDEKEEPYDGPEGPPLAEENEPFNPAFLEEEPLKGHRHGFQEAEIIEMEISFVENDEMVITEKKRTSKKVYDNAQTALRQLYDITGVKVEKCRAFMEFDHVRLLWETPDETPHGGPILLFLDYSTRYNSPSGMIICYRGEGQSNLIDSAEVMKPDNLDKMTDSELAVWYYNHSNFGDRRKIVRTEKYGVDGMYEIVLYMENGDYYTVNLSRSYRLLDSIYGPYDRDRRR